MENRLSPPLIGFAAAFFAAIVTLQSQTVANLTKRSAFLAPPPESIERFTFGFSESVADSLWLRWIQDGDTCQTYRGTETEDLEIDPRLAREFNNPRNKKCDLSWSYKMLDAVTKIAPRFKMPYLAGTMTLAVLVEDYDGASKLFDRAVEQYPDDWQILYRAAYHYLFDLKDLKRAADLLDRAADKGGPYWIRFLSARLNTRAGRAKMGLSALKRYLDGLTDPKQRESVISRMKDLERDARETPGGDGP